MGCHAFLQGIFPTQGSNPGLPHCRQGLYCLSHQGSPLSHKKNKIMLFGSTWMDLEIAILSKVSQTKKNVILYHFRSDQSLSRVWLFATPWIAARQASLSITNSWSSLRLTSIESVMPSSHLILCLPLLLLPPSPPSIRVFSNESTLHMNWPKYWNFIQL